jgi:hypothetical protein
MNAQMIETAILKQSILNCAPLPDLVLANIKDCLFYDPKSTAYKQLQAARKETQSKMCKVLQFIEESNNSRKVDDYFYEEFLQETDNDNDTDFRIDFRVEDYCEMTGCSYESWRFEISDEDLILINGDFGTLEAYTIEGCNCMKCGNYKNSPNDIPECIKCHCVTN